MYHFDVFVFECSCLFDEIGPAPLVPPGSAIVLSDGFAICALKITLVENFKMAAPLSAVCSLARFCGFSNLNRICVYTATRYLSGNNEDSKKTVKGMFLKYNLCVSWNLGFSGMETHMYYQSNSRVTRRSRLLLVGEREPGHILDAYLLVLPGSYKWGLKLSDIPSECNSHVYHHKPKPELPFYSDGFGSQCNLTKGMPDGLFDKKC